MGGPAKWVMHERHLEFCNTEQQADIVRRRLAGETVDQIAEAYGTPATNVSKTLRRVYSAASIQGYDPVNDVDGELPASLKLKGVTNMYRFEDGKRVLAQQYVLGRKISSDDTEEIIDAIESACSNITPRKPIKGPRHVRSDLLNLIHCTDYHLAMYAAREEGGDDWDTKIAEREFVRSVTELNEAAPLGGVGIFSQGGDFCHYDGLKTVTVESGHQLDSDTRAFRMVGLALDMHIFAIEQMLTRNRKVIAIIQEGNHDPMSSIWLRKALKRYFAKNKRVEVLDIDTPYYAYLFGDVMLAFHHGHRMGIKDVCHVFSGDPRFRKMWGAAKTTYCHMGHYHKKEQWSDEYGGVIAERHPTLAARDSYASSHGFLSRRAMNSITYHKDRGEISRRTTVPSHA